MKKIIIFALVAVAGAANAQVEWYGGDFDGRDAGNSQHGGAVASSLYFDNFNHTGGTITDIFGEFFDSGAAANGFANTAYYEIRSGMAAGNNGTLVSSGTVTGVTHVASTAAINTFDVGTVLNLYRYTASGLNINLAAGQYWLTFALDRSNVGAGQSFVATTGGFHGVGTPLHDGKTFVIDAQHSSAYAMSGSDFEGGGTWDLSYGVIAQAVPEPATMAALGLGVAAMLRRRNKKA